MYLQNNTKNSQPLLALFSIFLQFIILNWITSRLNVWKNWLFIKNEYYEVFFFSVGLEILDINVLDPYWTICWKQIE